MLQRILDIGPLPTLSLVGVADDICYDDVIMMSSFRIIVYQSIENKF